MNFALDEDHELLRDSAARFLTNESDLSKLLVPGATVASAGYAEHWTQIKNMGWPGLIIPEEFGGADLGCLEVSILATEIGRTLFASPLAGQFFATWAIMHATAKAHQEAWLPEIATGNVQITLAQPMDGNTIQLRNGRLDGTHPFVLDAGTADQILVAAQGESSWQLFAVSADAAGLTNQRQPWRDITREVCRLEFDAVEAELIGEDFTRDWPSVLARISTYSAAESVGGMHCVLDDAVEYAKERQAFGRPIGYYQAIKHPLAEVLGQLECARAASTFAAWALDADDPRALEGASIAKAYADEAYLAATYRNIQVFGAIGFTWEMKNHLYFKRARANAALFGTPSQHRLNVINQATHRQWDSPFNLVSNA